MTKKPGSPSPDRSYRLTSRPKGRETSFQVVVEETDVWVTGEMDLRNECAREIRNLRGQIKSYISFHPEFLTSLVPVSVPESAPEIIREMAHAAEVCGVGPMAGVAGVIAHFLARAFHEISPNILVENGGDIFMYSTRSRVVGLLPIPDEDMHLGVKIDDNAFPCSLCSSSGRFGHSLSLGTGDLVVVKAKEGALADCAATALANRITEKKDINMVMDMAEKRILPGIHGVFAQCGDKLGIWGDMELVEV